MYNLKILIITIYIVLSILEINCGSLEFSRSNNRKLRNLCPRNKYKMLYDVEAKQCSEIGIQGHCELNMIFYNIFGSQIYGQCDCDYSSPVPLVYHLQTKRCYFIYTQAYCEKSQWLEFKRDGKPICSDNKCIDFGRGFGCSPLAQNNSIPTYVPFQNTCVKLSSQCNNNDKSNLSDDDVVNTVGFVKRFLYPKCRKDIPDITTKFLSPTKTTVKCKPGSYLTILGRCQPSFDFD